MVDSSNFEQIRDLIKDDKIVLALDNMVALAKEFDSSLYNIAITIQSSYNRYRKKIQLGTIPPEVDRNEINTIVNSALNFLSDLERERHETKLNEERKELLDYQNDDLLKAAKSAVILVELEKIKYRYYHSEFHRRDVILEELRIYKPILTDISTIEIYNFLSEVSDSIYYKTSEDFGLKIFTLVTYFFPDDTEVSEYIYNQSIMIGGRLLSSGIFTFEDFKIGVYGLSIWKWVYLNAKRSANKTLISKVHSEYEKFKGFFYEDDFKVSNYEGKFKIIEIFEEDLKEEGLTFPNIPDDLLELC